uniref:Uncharacterized protein n=1 Tax=Rhodnius prolixus TaxID=13249 RepID=T1HV15_RHOPR
MFYSNSHPLRIVLEVVEFPCTVTIPIHQELGTNLKYLYDEESEKYKELNYEIEQLEQPESSGSPQKSSSRELAIALKNLKRLDTTLKVLNDVLFENVDYE